jgi:ferritin-like metal-binding protein YciE
MSDSRQMPMQTPQDLFVHELSDIRNAEQIIIQMLEQAQGMVQNPQLKEGLRMHAAYTGLVEKARAMGRTEAAQLLQQNLQEEQQMLQRVEQISQQLTQQMASMSGRQSGQQASASGT